MNLITCSLNIYFSCGRMVYDSVAEWSMALVLGTSLLGGKGSNPFTVMQEHCLSSTRIFFNSTLSLFNTP